MNRPRAVHRNAGGLGAATLLTAALTIALAACGDASTDAPIAVAGAPPSVRDSAGVTIVENEAPLHGGASAWRLADRPVVRLRAHDGGETNLLLDPASIDVDRRGRLVVADGLTAGWDEVLVFDSAGAPLLRFGGNGEGPGEFGQLWWARVYRGDTIAAMDMVRDHVSLFTADGAHVRDIPAPRLAAPERRPGMAGFVPGFEGFFADGSVLAASSGWALPAETPGVVWYRQPLVRISPDGASVDSLGIWPIMPGWWNGQTVQSRVFGPYMWRAVDDSTFHQPAPSGAWEVQTFDMDGSLRRILRRPHTQRLVGDDLKQAFEDWTLDRMGSSPESSPQVMDRVRERLSTQPYADTLAAIGRLLVDDEGRLWVGGPSFGPPHSPNVIPGAVTWSVFDADGRWLSEVEVQAREYLVEVARGRAWVITIDELDVKEIRAYALETGSAN